MAKNSDWIDISISLHPGMVHWPGDPMFSISHVSDLQKGDVCTVSRFQLGTHTGTHMDAPKHFVSGGASIDQIDFEAVIGSARVLAIQDPVSIQPSELEKYKIQKGERILFKTRNSSHPWQQEKFHEDAVYFSKEGAEFLAHKGVRTVGIDYLSVSGFHQDPAVPHRALLEAGIWIIETLDLFQVEPGNYQLICLPLKILSGDGAPARALLKPLKEVPHDERS